MEAAAVVQADDSAGGGAVDDAAGDLVGEVFPVEAEDGPHDAGEVVVVLGGGEAEPAAAVGGAEVFGAEVEDVFAGLLGGGDFAFDKSGAT